MPAVFLKIEWAEEKGDRGKEQTECASRFLYSITQKKLLLDRKV
jgi:hypothetical protein